MHSPKSKIPKAWYLTLTQFGINPKNKLSHILHHSRASIEKPGSDANIDLLKPQFFVHKPGFTTQVQDVY